MFIRFFRPISVAVDRHAGKNVNLWRSHVRPHVALQEPPSAVFDNVGKDEQSDKTTLDFLKNWVYKWVYRNTLTRSE